MKSFFFLLLSHYCITGFHIKSSIIVPSYSSSSSQLSSTQNGNIWAVRRKLIRTCFLDEAKKRATEPEKSEEDSLLEMEKNKDASFKLTLGVSAFFIAIGKFLHLVHNNALF